MKNHFSLAALLLASAATCASGTQTGISTAGGLAQAQSTLGADETFERLDQAVMANPNASVVTRVDHRFNALAVNMDLRPTRLLVFGNPTLGTPLIQQAQTTGIDLPQKFLVYEDADARVFAAYNSVPYLLARHGITGVDQAAGQIAGALKNLAEGATGGTVDPALATGDGEVSLREGLVIAESAFGMDETFERLEQAIRDNANLFIDVIVDHQANAALVNMDLRPTRLIIYGSARAGTPLMQSAQTTGIDLPQKFLVYEDAEGRVWVAYNDPLFLAQRHGITDRDEALQQIATALAGLALAATQP